MSVNEHKIDIANTTPVMFSNLSKNTTSVISKKTNSIKEILIEKILLGFTILSSILILFVIGFILSKSLPVLQANGLSFFLEKGWDQNFIEAWVTGGEIKSLTFGALP